MEIRSFWAWYGQLTEASALPKISGISVTVCQLERQVQRVEALEWQFTEYRKKTEKGDETII